PRAGRSPAHGGGENARRPRGAARPRPRRARRAAAACRLGARVSARRDPAWRYIRWMRTLFVLVSLLLVPQAIDAPRITQQDFKKLVAAKNVVIVDTRNADAYPQGHIPGALLLPLEGTLTWPESYEK